MKSMTGFGRGTVTANGFSVSIELKTVNNRFLDVSLRLSNELQALEAILKRQIGNRLSRGRVEVNIQYERNDEVNYDLNRPLISGFLSAMKRMQEEFALSGEPDINVIARIPNVIISTKNDLDENFVSGVEAALNLALDDLEKMRSDEGTMLRSVLESHLDAISARVPSIAAETENVAEEYRQRLTKRISEMLAKSESQIELDQTRLAQEVAYLSDRSDISEEIARLSTHIEHFRDIMNDEKEVGKRLDFLTQELNREANTIASKSNNAIIKENALELKSEIEKIREQIQNVE